MKRVIHFHESRIRTDSWLLWLMVVLGALALTLAATALGGTAYYSIEGYFGDGGATQSFLFDVESTLSSSEPFSLRTWHYSGTPTGETNAAGDSISGGGFDPILYLYGGEALAAVDDDIDRSVFNYDAELTWGSATYRPEEIALRYPLRSGAYRLELKALGGSLGGGGPEWAVDLVAPADKVTLTGVAYDGNTNIQSVSFGSSDLSSIAKIAIPGGQALSMTGHFVVGKSGRGDIELSGGAIASGNSWLAYDRDSLGSVALEDYAVWSADTVQLGRFGQAGLLVASHSQAEFYGNAFVAYYDTSSTTVTVNGAGSLMTVHGDLEVGDGGYGGLHIEDHGQVDSRGVGTSGQDVVGDDSTAHGEVTVEGAGALWQTDKLVVGNYGQGTVDITGGGKIATTGNAYIGYNAAGGNSRVALMGAVPGGAPSTWEVSGDLYIAGNETGPSNALQSHLTINPGGLVEVTGTTKYWDSGGWLELHGGTLKTGALVKGCGQFGWTSGTLELTGSGLVLDNSTPDSAFGHDLTIASGKSLLLSSPHPHDKLVIGETGSGTLRVENGGSVTSKSAVYIANKGHLASGSLFVTGTNSSFTAQAPMFVGAEGTGTMTVETGGHVQTGGDAKIGSGLGIGRAEVHGATSRWDIGGSIEVGQGYLEIYDQAVVTSGNATISGGAGATSGHALVDGFTVGIGTPARWDVTGNMSIVNDTSGLSVMRNGRVNVTGDIVLGPTGPGSSGTTLSVQSSGQVDIGGTLRVRARANLGLAGSGSIHTRSLIVEPTGRLKHDNGTLTIDGGMFAMEAGQLVIDSESGAPIIRLQNGAQGIVPVPAFATGILAVGKNDHGRLEILSGATLTSSTGWISSWGPIQQGAGGGHVLVQGTGSLWRITADNGGGPGTGWGDPFEIGHNQEGTLEILDGGQVIVAGPVFILGWPRTGGQGGPGTVIVDGPNSLLRATTDPSGTVASPGRMDIGIGTAGPSTEAYSFLTVSNGGRVEVDDRINVRGTSTVTLTSGSTIRAASITNRGTMAGVGTVVVTSQFENSGVVSPGLSTGLLNISGDYVQDAAGTLTVELGGTSQSEHDRLRIVNGSATLGGRLAIELIAPPGGTNVFQPRAGDSFEILTATGGVYPIPGFTEYVWPPLSGDLTWGLSYDPTSVVLSVLGPSILLGDYNQNGTVDAADYVVWCDNVGANITLPNEDPSQTPGWVTDEDYTVWRAHFGQSAGSSSAAIADLSNSADTAIPEPPTIVLLGWVTIFLVIGRHAAVETQPVDQVR